MKCEICGKESGNYKYCKECYAKTKNSSNNSVHTTDGKTEFLYSPKDKLITAKEQEFYSVISTCLPEGYLVFPQINLASIIVKNDTSRFHNELFRNIDFLLTDAAFKPLIAIEINDQTHLTRERKERDEKVTGILEEAGIPLLKFWTSYGANKEYIGRKISEAISSLPVERVHHFTDKTDKKEEAQPSSAKKKNGCYIATCVYGSYDCPQVWVLRRYRDLDLSASMPGKAFISLYYAVSPWLVKLFGRSAWFHALAKAMLDPIVERLIGNGYSDEPYSDN